MTLFASDPDVHVVVEVTDHGGGLLGWEPVVTTGALTLNAAWDSAPVTVGDKTTRNLRVNLFGLAVGGHRLVLVVPDGNDIDLGYYTLQDTAADNLVVTPDEVATRAGLTLPLDDATRLTITDAILAAQSDVYAYLGREIMPTSRVETGRWAFGDGWRLDRLGDDPLVSVTSAVAELDVVTGLPTGYFTITYTCGINARDDAEFYPIKRYVMAHTLYSPEFTTLWKATSGARGEVKSLSAEGQSVSFAAPTLAGSATTGTKPGDLTPGTLPTLASLDRWRVAGRRVYQAATQASDWPFLGRRW